MTESDLGDELRRAMGAFKGEAATEQALQGILAATQAALRSIVGKQRRPRTRKEDEASLAAALCDQMRPLATDETRRFLFWAAHTGAYIVAPFMLGLPSDYDPRKRLGESPDGVLRLLCARFKWGEMFPANLIHLERMRREGRIVDWGFRRESATKARALVTPKEPAEFITVKFSVSDAEACDGE